MDCFREHPTRSLPYTLDIILMAGLVAIPGKNDVEGDALHQGMPTALGEETRETRKVGVPESEAAEVDVLYRILPLAGNGGEAGFLVQGYFFVQVAEDG